MERKRKRMQRTVIKGIRYGYLVGQTYIAVKTYRDKNVEHPLISFMIPYAEDARTAVRAAILRHLGEAMDR